MSDDDQTRDEIEETVNDEPVQEPVQEEEIKPVKAKFQAKAQAKPKIKIIKEPVEPVESVEPVEPEPVIKEEKLKNSDKLKKTVNCPDCNLSMTQHTLKYIYTKNFFVKGRFEKKLNNNLKSM